MVFDDLSIVVRVCVVLLGPPALTILCWLLGPRLAGRLFARAYKRSWKEFWALLLAAYLMFALAIAGGKMLSGRSDEDPTSVLLQ